MKTFKLAILAIFILSVHFVYAQQKTVKVVRCKGQSFTSLNVSNGLNVKVVNDTCFRVFVTAPKDYLDKVITTVKNGTLEIKIKDGTANVSSDADGSITVNGNGNIVCSNSNVNIVNSNNNSGNVVSGSGSGSSIDVQKITITVHRKGNLTSVTTSSAAKVQLSSVGGSAITLNASSGSEIEIANLKCTKSLKINASSAGEIEIKKLETPLLTLNASSGSDVEIAGHAKKADLTASSGANVDVDELKMDNVTKNVSSGGEIDL